MARPRVDESEKCIRKDISIKQEQYDRLVIYCDKTERPISWVIRKALDEYLSSHDTT